MQVILAKLGMYQMSGRRKLYSSGRQKRDSSYISAFSRHSLGPVCFSYLAGWVVQVESGVYELYGEYKLDPACIGCPASAS